MDWLYFTIMALLAIVLGAFGSVFNTYSSLYLAKDNDLLLSMPIPVRTILLSRLLSVYLMGLMYSGVVLLPAMIVYWVTVCGRAAAPLQAVCCCLLLVTIFVLTLSCALGWVVARISLKLKHQQLYHGGTDVAAVPRRLLFRVFQGAELPLGACDERSATTARKSAARPIRSI